MLLFHRAGSAALAALLIVQVRHGCPLRPRLTAMLAGLASAAAAVALLTLIHPFDANAPDLAADFLAVLLIVLGVGWASRQERSFSKERTGEL